MACYACNPYCGRCHRAWPQPIECPNCGKLNIIEEVSGNVCTKCGKPLPDAKRIRCAYTGRMCQRPCLRARKPALDGKLHPCPHDGTPQVHAARS